jgi:serine/threonine protein kinase
MRESTDPADFSRNRKLKRILMLEAEIMEHMKHDRIVLFIGLRLTPLSLVMEYLPLGNLKELIEVGTDIKSWEVRYQMMLDICEGMEFLHAIINPTDGTEKMRCFHQDLKTGNVLLEMLDGSMRAKIADFGMSCMYSFMSKIF